MYTNVVYYYRYGVNGKACVEKYEELKTATNKDADDFYDTKLMLKTEKVHMLEDNSQSRKIMD